MNSAVMRQRIKPFMLPIAMVIGIVFHKYMHYVEWTAPYLIFIMLFVAFCKIRPSEFKVTRLSGMLICIQILGAVALYLALRPLNLSLATGCAICVFCPTATAAPVITGMLGGNISRLVTYSIVSNVTVAILAPVLFTLCGDGASVDFMHTMLKILSRVVPLIVVPLVCAFSLLYIAPKAHNAVASHQSLSFYVWAVSLCIVVGRAVSYIMLNHDDVMLMFGLAAGALVVCCLQFYIGRRVGLRCGDKIAGAQGLGQKNTVLAIWMVFEFFDGHPIASVAPAAYIAWQNIINSAQLYYKSKSMERAERR